MSRHLKKLGQQLQRRFCQRLAGFGWSAVSIRRAVPADRAALQLFFAELGRRSLAQRFHCAFKRLSPQRIAALSEQALTQNSRVQMWVAVANEGGQPRVVAQGGWCVASQRPAPAQASNLPHPAARSEARDPFAAPVSAPAVGELALVVAERYQGQGIGTRLLSAMRQGACQSGLLGLQACVRSDNVAMQALLHSRGQEASAAGLKPGARAPASGATFESLLDTTPGWRWRQALPLLASLLWLLRPLPRSGATGPMSVAAQVDAR